MRAVSLGLVAAALLATNAHAWRADEMASMCQFWIKAQTVEEDFAPDKTFNTGICWGVLTTLGVMPELLRSERKWCMSQNVSSDRCLAWP